MVVSSDGDRYDVNPQWIGSGGKDSEATAATAETATLHRPNFDSNYFKHNHNQKASATNQLELLSVIKP